MAIGAVTAGAYTRSALLAFAFVIEGSTSQRVRLRIYQHFQEHARPPVVEELMNEFGLERAATVAILRELADARHIALVRGTSRVLMAFPYSAIATPFRVTADGKSYFANCAWDAIAFHQLLNTSVDVDSRCHHCAAPIRISLRDGQATLVNPAETLVYLALKPTQWWEDIITTCSNTMVFFCGPDHRDASDLSKSSDSAASLTPQKVHELGKPLYSNRFAIDYERPTAQQLTAHFDSLGLTSPFWQV